MQGIQEIEPVAKQAEVPAANVLVSPPYGAIRRSDSRFAAENFMHKPFTKSGEYDHIVPESEELYLHTTTSKVQSQIFDLRTFSATVHAGKRNQQLLVDIRSRHVTRVWKTEDKGVSQ
jgi:hypothetical protein